MRVFLWSFDGSDNWHQCNGETCGELLDDITKEVLAYEQTEDGDRVYVCQGRYADPAADFDIVDFFENQEEENQNAPSEEDWVTYGVSLEECAIITAEIQEVIRKHMRRLGMDEAFAWCLPHPPVTVTFYGGRPNISEEGILALGFPSPTTTGEK